MKEIYIVHAGEFIGCYKAGKCPMISYAPNDKFIDFVKGLREDYPDFKLRCVVNDGITEKVIKRIKADRLLMGLQNQGR